MKTRIAHLKHQAGFTIIEVLVAMVVLLLGVLATTTLLNTANAETERNQARNGATNLVRDIIEASRALSYDSVNPTKDSTGAADTTIVTSLQGMGPTSSGTGAGSSFADTDPASGWQITRRGTRFNVTVDACVVDDAKDGVVSPHTPAASDGSGYYCPNLPSTPPGDSNGDDYRRIKVTAAWTSNSCNSCSNPGAGSVRTYSVSQTAVIINPSGGLGPAPIGPIQNPTTVVCPNFSKTYTQAFDKSATGAVFTVNDDANTSFTATVPTTVDPATGAKTYTFTYSPSPTPPDNTYQVQAQAFNAAQQFGRISVGSAYINCHEPPDVQNVNGGFDWRRCTVYPATCGNGQRVFDIDWNPSPDADVVGYYVYRVNGVEDWQSSPTRPANDPADTQVACISRTKLAQSPQPSPLTTTMPGPLDFLEPFQPACWDEGVPGQPSLGNILGLITFPGTRAKYWVQALDPDPNVDPSGPSGLVVRPSPTNHSATLDVTENMLNVPPTPPVVSVSNVSGQPCLSWTDSIDLNYLGGSITNPIRFYRIYRDSNLVASVSVTYWNGNANVSANVPDVPYTDRLGRATPNAGGSCDTTNPARSWFKDSTAGADNWHYWVTAVDQNYLESFPSNTVNWTAPGP